MEELYNGKVIRINENEYQNIFVVSDIHNDFNTFMEAVETLKINKSNNLLVIAGDLIDRGKQPKELLDYVFKESERKNDVIYLKGNHEDMLVDYIRSELHPSVPICCREPYSYNTPEILMSENGFSEEMMLELAERLSKLPLVLEIEFKEEIFRIGHASLPDKMNMKKIFDEDILWGEQLWESYYTRYYKNERKMLRLITGHIPTKMIRVNLGNLTDDEWNFHIWFSDDKNGELVQKIAIDCGNAFRSIYKNAYLGFLNLKTMETFYF